MIDFMFSADFFTPSPSRAADRLVAVLGLPPWKPTWTDLTPEQLIYLRARGRMDMGAPTLIEILSSGSHEELYMTVPALRAQRDDRPMRTHATVFVSSDFDALVARAEAHGVRHFALPGGHGGLDRCWFGVTSLEPDAPGAKYEPETDGGLFVEVINWEGTAVAQRPPSLEKPEDGEIVRVSARTFLVDDIEATMAALNCCLDWPDPGMAVIDSGTDRYLVLQPSVETSAALELVQPLGPASRHQEFFGRWGPGPHAIRIDVQNLAAKADDLKRRGTRFTDAVSVSGDPLLVVDPSLLDGLVVEFRGSDER